MDHPSKKLFVLLVLCAILIFNILDLGGLNQDLVHRHFGFDPENPKIDPHTDFKSDLGTQLKTQPEIEQIIKPQTQTKKEHKNYIKTKLKTDHKTHSQSHTKTNTKLKKESETKPDKESKSLTISGVLLSTAGTYIPLANLQMTLNHDKTNIMQVATSDKDGKFTFEFKDIDSSVPYTCAISAKKLIPNYFYGAVIASNIKVPALEHEFTLPYPIVLKEGGYGGFQIEGRIESSVGNKAISQAQVLFQVPSNGKTYQALGMTDTQGDFTIHIFGLAESSYEGTLTLANTIQGFEAPNPLAKLKIPSGTVTIITQAPFVLKPAKVCDLVGCQDCAKDSNQSCKTCKYGYTLKEDTKECKFTGDFSGSGVVSVPVNPFSKGKITSITGTVRGVKLKVISILTDCIACFYTTDPKTCVAVGGTNSVGFFSMDVKTYDFNGQYQGFLIVSQKDFISQTIEIQVRSDQNIQNIGDIVLMNLEEPKKGDKPKESEGSPKKGDTPKESEGSPKKGETPKESEGSPKKGETPKESESSPKKGETPKESESSPKKGETPKESESSPKKGKSPTKKT